MDEVDMLNDAMTELVVGEAETVHAPCGLYYVIGELLAHLEVCPVIMSC